MRFVTPHADLFSEIADDGHYSWTHDVVITSLIVYLIKLKNGKLCWCEWKGPGDAIHEDRLIGYPTKVSLDRSRKSYRLEKEMLIYG